MKTLVGYVSKHGSTEIIANWIAEKIKGEVHVQDLSNVKSLDEYDFLVMGGPIYDEQPLPELREFITNHKACLEKIKKAIFVIVTDEREGNRKKHYTDLMHNIVPKPIKEVQLFSGVIDMGVLNDVEKQQVAGYYERKGETAKSTNYLDKNECVDFGDRINQYNN